MEQSLKEIKKHFSKLGLRYFFGTLIVLAVQTIPLVLVQLLCPEWLENDDVALLISTLPMYLIGMPILILMVRKLPAVTPERHHMSADAFFQAAIMCLALVYVTNIIGNLLTAAIGNLKGSAVSNVVADLAASVSPWTVLIYMVIIAPIMEEYVFRKLIVDRTCRYGQGVAIVLSGLMFGLFHGNLNQFVYAFALGAFLAYLYVQTGNLKITIALHMIINFFGGLVSTLLLGVIDEESLIEAASSGSQSILIAYAMQNLSWLLLYEIYVLFLVGVTITGIVLFILSFAKKRFSISAGEVSIPKGKRFSTVILNLGMILYCLIWLIVMIAQLLS